MTSDLDRLIVGDFVLYKRDAALHLGVVSKTTQNSVFVGDTEFTRPNYRHGEDCAIVLITPQAAANYIRHEARRIQSDAIRKGLQSRLFCLSMVSIEMKKRWLVILEGKYKEHGEAAHSSEDIEAMDENDVEFAILDHIEYNMLPLMGCSFVAHVYKTLMDNSNLEEDNPYANN